MKSIINALQMIGKFIAVLLLLWFTVNAGIAGVFFAAFAIATPFFVLQEGLIGLWALLGAPISIIHWGIAMKFTDAIFGPVKDKTDGNS